MTYYAGHGLFDGYETVEQVIKAVSTPVLSGTGDWSLFVVTRDDPEGPAPVVLSGGIDLASERATLFLGERFGYQPEVPAIRHDLVFSGRAYEPPLVFPPARSRLLPETALRAVREFLAGGGEPGCVRWSASPPVEGG